MAESIRVFIADDHELVRKGLRALLETEDDIEVIGEASNGREAVERVIDLMPDVVLMDLMMPEKTGTEAIEEIIKLRPEIRILVLTSFIDGGKIFAAVQAGALGYLVKDSSPEVLFQSIQSVARGAPSLSADIVMKLMQGVGQEKANNTITEREKEVLRFLARGFSNLDIASKLNISERTVSTHISTILRKLGLNNRVQATLYALRVGWVSLTESQ